MPGEDKNFGVSLILDFRTWWRHVQATEEYKNQEKHKYRKVHYNKY